MERSRATVENLKPFFGIPLSSKEGPDRKRPPDHDRFRDQSGRMELQIEVVSEYLYVGSGNLELFDLKGRKQAYYALPRHNGQLVIPGSAIKGAVRSIAEAISGSCVRVADRGERTGSWRACSDEGLLCAACRLFGATGYRGRVHLSDAAPVAQVEPDRIKIADLWPPRQSPGRKFYRPGAFQSLDKEAERNHRFIEVVPKGSRFSVTLYFENTTRAEMGLLMRALGLDLIQRGSEKKVVFAFPVKLGGAKPRCLGAARLNPKRLYLVRQDAGLTSSLLQGGQPAALLNTLGLWLEDDSLLDSLAWQMFREKFALKAEPCPPEVY